jgi:hypothetical protein
MIGPGDFSVDNIIDFMPSGWTPLALALGIGVGSALAQLLICYRPSNPKSV